MKTTNPDFEFFLKSHDELLKQYKDKFIAISNKNVIAQGNSLEEALDSALKKGYQLGKFIVQLCTEGESGYTQTFHTRAIFS